MIKDLCKNKILRNIHLKKYLFKHSFRMFLTYMLASIMIISLNESATWYSVITRTITIGSFSTLIFYINIHIISYYKQEETLREKHRNYKQRIFITGYIITTILFVIYHNLALYLTSIGYELYLPNNIRSVRGWKMLLYVLYISLLQYTFIYMIQTFTLSEYEKGQVEVELLKLKSANSETVNLLLKQQIQPHFLFNALNTLKSLIRKRPAQAEEYLLHLSDFLRASFANKTSGLSTISEELKICNDYMEMQYVRFRDAVDFEIEIDYNDPDLEKNIPVFSLQPLLENAIKHNISTLENPLYLRITKDEHYITVTNNLQYKKSIENSTGSGLANLRERYNIISGDEVIINKTDTTFSVSIKML